MRALVATGAVLACLSVAAVAAPADADDGDAPPERDADSRPLPPVQSGYVFIDGRYLPLPYEVSESEDGEQVLINGEVLPGEVTFGHWGGRPGRSRGWGWGPRFGPRSRGGAFDRDGGESRKRSGWRLLRSRLEDDQIVAAFTDERVVMLDHTPKYAFFKMLLDFDPQSPEFQGMCEMLPDKRVIPTWSDWLAEGAVSDELRTRAQKVIDHVERVVAENKAVQAAARRYEAAAYPLTLLGMIAGVLALGHLLMSMPNRQTLHAEGGIPPEIIRATLISVGLIAALSGLDLVWTILASQAGQMRELNPIGSRLIDDPQALIAFKVSATLLGCGLLYALRKHARAQLASWWLCLVCTVLTFRWLMFNSMFIA